MQTRVLSDKERVAWLRLFRTDRIGPATFHQLMSRTSYDAESALGLLSQLSKAGRNLTAPSIAQVEDEIARARKAGARLLAICEPEYPEPLAQISDAPPVITIRGDGGVFLKPGIAMVGARNASAAGRRMARDIARELAREGYAIISGLARGIDAEAHAAALSSSGSTIAVLAGGVDSVYPPEHRKLYDEIAESGLIVSERPLGYVAKGRDFPKRNRIIGGLSLGVLVVEAARRSGSLISARMALEQGREVMAVPGSPLDERTAGSNGLIKQGAWLIENAEDVVNALEGMATQRKVEDRICRFGLEPVLETEAPAEHQARLKQVLSPTPASLEDLASASGLSLIQTRAALSELELSGDAESHIGGMASLPLD